MQNSRYECTYILRRICATVMKLLLNIGEGSKGSQIFQVIFRSYFKYIFQKKILSSTSNKSDISKIYH